MITAKHATCTVAALLLSVLWCPPAGATKPSADELERLLARLPADDTEIQQQLLALEPVHIRALCARLQPAGVGGDAQARYALHGLTIAAAAEDAPTTTQSLVRTLVAVLRSDDLPADPVFITEQLALLSQEQALAALRRGLDDPRWRSAATRATVAIGGAEAVHALRDRAQGSVAPAEQLMFLHALNQLGAPLVSAQLARLAADALARGVAPTDPLYQELLQTTALGLAHSEDGAVRREALAALARVGVPGLDVYFTRELHAQQEARDHRAFETAMSYARHLARAGHDRAAARLLRAWLHDAATAPARQCAVLSTLAESVGSTALPELLAALTAEQSAVASTARRLVVTLPAPETTELCLAVLPEASPTLRTAVLEVLGARGDERALEPVAQAMHDQDPTVAVAAIKAVAHIGEARAIHPLIDLLAQRNEPIVRDALEQVLAEILGVEATEAIATRVLRQPKDVQVRLLHVLAKRPPNLAALRPVSTSLADEDIGVRLAAIHAAEQLLGHPVIPDLLRALARSRSESERTAIEDALVAVSRRHPNPDIPVELIVAPWEQLNPDARMTIVRALGRIGGRGAMQALFGVIKHEAPDLQVAALRAFATWPDLAVDPAEQLFELSQRTDELKRHVLALRAFLHVVGLSGRPAADRLDLYTAAMRAARRVEEQKLALAGLGRLRDAAVFDLLYAHLDDPALRAEAAAAIISVAEALLPHRWRAAREPLQRVLAADVPTPLKQRSQAVLDRVAAFEGYITDWWVSGPYMQPGHAGHELLDVPFPPEQPDETAHWRKQPVRPEANYAWAIDLSATMPGDNRAGYLLTRVHSPQSQQLELELGSDDGIKAWINGEVVHRHDVLRGLDRGQDIVEVTLQKGWNTLLLKVTNDGGGWGACARFRTPDGDDPSQLEITAGDKPA